MICNINSTNFEPYCRFAGSLGIPYVIITDGDYYHIVDEKKHFGDIEDANHVGKGFDGIDRIYLMYQTSLDKGTQRKTTENELPSLTQCTA